jgi:predicted nucleotidyltransferase
MDRQTLVTSRQFANAVKRHWKVHELILFGSRARGDNFVTSDYDFVMISEDFAGKRFIRRASPLYKFWHSNRDLDVLCYTPEEWRRLKNRRGILLNAQSEGKRLL